MAVVTPTDRPKSVRNCCLIELFCGVVCVVTLPFDISVGVGAFVIGLGQISSFFVYDVDLQQPELTQEAIRVIVRKGIYNVCRYVSSELLAISFTITDEAAADIISFTLIGDTQN